MPAHRIMGIFCEDIREEVGGLHTLVGIYPDGVYVPTIPSVLIKFALYVRATIDPDEEAKPISMWLISPKGEERELNRLDEATIEKAKSEVRAAGTPFATIISKILTTNFPITEYGMLKAVARIDGKEVVLCSVAFKAPEAISATAPSPPV